MTVVLTILLWILAVLGFVLLALLVIPVHGRARGTIQGFSAEGQAAVRWAWGLIQFKASSQAGLGLYLFGLRIHRIKPGAEKEDKPQKPKKKKKKKEKGKVGGLMAFLGNRRVLFRAGGRLLRALRMRGRLAGRVGFDDPADTASLYTLLLLARDRVPGLDLQVECDFTEEVLELAGDLRLRVWVIHLGIVFLALWLNKETRQALRAVS